MKTAATLYRKKPVTVEAWQYTGQPREEWPEWAKRQFGNYSYDLLSMLLWHWCIKGKMSWISNKKFEATYEPA